MNRKIIIINGYLASGKSTFASCISKALNIPCIIKDTFKTALCTSVSIDTAEKSSAFSTITFDGIIYMTEKLIEMGYPVIIEGNFVPAGIKKTDEAGIIKALVNKYNCAVLTFKFKGDTQVLYKRFVKREKSPERGQANTMFAEISHNEFAGFCRNLDGFDVGGKTIEINTTDFDKVDFQGYIEIARQFIEKDNTQ